MFYFIKLILVIILFLWLVLLFFEVEWGRDLEGVGCCHSSHDSAEFQNILELPSLTGCAHSLHLCSNHDLRICDIAACYRFRTRNTDMDMMTSWCSPLPVGPDPLSCFFVIVVVFSLYVLGCLLLLFWLYQEPISGSTCRQHDGNKLSPRFKIRLTSCVFIGSSSMKDGYGS